MLTRYLFVVANLHFVFVTSAKEVLFLSVLVCLLAGLHKVAHNAGIDGATDSGTVCGCRSRLLTAPSVCWILTVLLRFAR